MDEAIPVKEAPAVWDRAMQDRGSAIARDRETVSAKLTALWATQLRAGSSARASPTGRPLAELAPVLVEITALRTAADSTVEGSVEAAGSLEAADFAEEAADFAEEEADFAEAADVGAADVADSSARRIPMTFSQAAVTMVPPPA